MATITSPRPQSPASSVRSAQRPHSPSLTPASSVRTSLDLPPGARPPSPAPGNPAQRRNRAALRDYYKLKAKPPSSVAPPTFRTASITSTRSADTITNATTLADDATTPTSTLPHEIDSPTFNAEIYVQSLLKTCNLNAILRTEATLISEIKNLDGERKALVYDNYSKLIKATQTIGKMQQGLSASNVGDWEELKPAVENIGRMAGELDRSSRRSGIDEKSTEKGERRKGEMVRWVIDAPARFEVYTAEGRREEIDMEWKTISNALDRWRGVKGVDGIRSRCEQIVARTMDDAG